jgi:6,7-dimethyl-8-ribityllumazine synthase
VQTNQLFDYTWRGRTDFLKSARFCLITSRWLEEITSELEKGALTVLQEAGVEDWQITKLYVPGSFEIPVATAWWLKKMQPEKNMLPAAIGLGCVLTGETKHNEYICHAVAQSLSQLGAQSLCPVIFGVLTPDTLTQARERIGGAHGHKGKEAALTALSMLELKAGLEI